VVAVDLLDRRGGAIATRLAQYTGKSYETIHLKHLVDTPWRHWYLGYLEPDDVDVGCANGAHTLSVARRVRRVYGMDAHVARLSIGFLVVVFPQTGGAS
jgi:2-polyprenyl-3-methyl-5-hydroxy-6-metoxy-1,4-benzoquinol methylase